MYVRAVKHNNKDGTFREYLQLVESYRDKGRVKQRIIANLGRLGTAITEKKVDQVIESLEKHAGKVSILNVLKDLKTKSSKAYGELQIHRKVFEKLGIEKELKKRLAKTDKQVDYVEAIFMAISNRLQDPKSKKGTAEWKEDVYEPKWEQLELQHVYRGMDFLIEQKDEIEGALFDQTRDLFNCKVNVAMFDTTSVSYWGKGKDEIFQHGHAKNKRFDLKQLVVGIVMDRDGTPLGHEVWPGNMSDRPAFKEVITKIKKKFSIEKVILVCDRGMVSEGNISFLEEENYEYILGVKLRQMTETRQRLLLEETTFGGFKELGSVSNVGSRLGKEVREHALWEAEERDRIETKRAKAKAEGKVSKVKDLDSDKLREYKDSKKGQRRWVVCLNPILAEEDKQKREYFQQILENKVEFRTAKEWIVKNGYKKYVKIKELSIELDHDRLERDELYDGKWALISNTSLPIASLVSAYKDLAQIELHFRTLKSELEMGPVYHYTERRVRAHIFICFLALQIRTYITKKLKEIDPKLSYLQVMRDVAKIRANCYDVKGKQYIQRTEFQGDAHLAFRGTGTKIPPDFLSTPDSKTSPESVVTTS